ncbi:hypothetical protein B7H23_10475 [Notoacmeibacter marinus]|uniref:DUF995 domain-containing protein n=1 Tax=Notoacmeibacter marinus TaxID=1876515 RepID=A0A231UX47_9HYPH|nr:hypothetical protein [Notoacmeibacter marinus]OXT00529.1 hypothetical protein B7H23_10475 [Notoacmeibacter marinus]
MRHFIVPTLAIAAALVGAPPVAEAKTMTAAEIKQEMEGKTIIARRFGMKITMNYRPDGTVTARALIGSVDGTWRAKGNQVCTTFPRGPAKGTECVTFEKIGPNQYRNSMGVKFRVQ